MKTNALSLALALAACGCAPTLAGQLKGPGGEVVTSPEARVNIVSLAPGADAQGVVVAEVDGDGAFATSADLAPGDYLVEALVPGYGLVSERVRVGETEKVELTLKPLPKAKTGAIGANTGLDAGRGAGGATLTPPSL